MDFIDALNLIATFLAGFLGVYGALWVANWLLASRAEVRGDRASRSFWRARPRILRR